jgi:cathepsin A (carboxypeptidase C)
MMASPGKVAGIDSTVMIHFSCSSLITITPPYFWPRKSTANTYFPFTVTAPCEIDLFCYPSTPMIAKYLNLKSSFDALGVPSAIQNYSLQSPGVARAFELSVDEGISTAPQLQYLLANQIDILIYQGNLDLACNTAGAKRWTSKLQWKGQAEFTSKELKPWKSIANGKETKAGKFKEVNIKVVEGDEKTTRFALVTIDKSGHMVCYTKTTR